MIRESYLNYRHFLFLKVFLLLSLLTVVIYLIDDPIFGTNGGSVLGLTYGILAAIGIIILMWYGIRKRKYHSYNTTLRGALAFHIWLGSFLLILATLHCGFEFGWNVHTAAYLLMFFTIISGIWGIIAYQTYAPLIQSHRGAMSADTLSEELDQLSQQLTQLKANSSEKVCKLADKLDLVPIKSIAAALGRVVPNTIDTNAAAAFMTGLSPEDREQSLKIIEKIDKRMALNSKLQHELRTLFWIKIWLYTHVPLACGCIIALMVHVFVVCYYW